jgi:hypothetical protein
MDSNPVILQKPSEETLKQIDFVIQGLENGKYKEIAKAVEFHQKLKGDDDPTYASGLWAFIELQQNRIEDLQLENDNSISKIIDLTNRTDELENRLADYTANMRGIANALLKLGNPDPFDQDYSTVPHKHDADTFITNWKSKF